MKCEKFEFFLIASFAFLISTAGLRSEVSAATVTANGQAYITASISLEEYRQRAVENALQNILNARKQALRSFSVVENGQMLIDQIQSMSHADILNYEIINEYRRDNIYYVNIEALVDEDSSTDDRYSCRTTDISEVDLKINVSGDKLKFPAWVSVDSDWLHTEVRKNQFEPTLSLMSKPNFHANSPKAYTLFENTELVNKKQNTYRLEAEIFYDLAEDDYVLLKNSKLNLSINFTIFRFNKPVAFKSLSADFKFSQTLGRDLASSPKRKLWAKKKNEIAERIISEIRDQLTELNCITINPTLEKIGSIVQINYGKKDGVKASDVFIISDNNLKKLYLKVINLKDHRTELELISKTTNIESLVGKKMRIVEGL